MNKRYYRFFGGMLAAQEAWLNQMAEKGYRLVRCGQASYEFEETAPGQVQYCVEFIGQKSRQSAEDYKIFLEEMGYRVFYKNLNWHYSAGKVTLRPWAERGGRIATQATTLDRELLIVEKENDGKPFQLHTTFADQAEMYRTMQRPWLFFFLVFAVLGALRRMPALCAVGLMALIPALLYQMEIWQLRKKDRVREWGETSKPVRRAGVYVLAGVLAAALALWAVSTLSGGMRSFSGSRIGWSEHKSRESWSASYTYFNGQSSGRLKAAGDSTVLYLEIETEKGVLGLEVKDADGTILFAEPELASSAFTLETTGSVTLHFTAQGHCGSFRAGWR